jgi:hypothetical protein
MQPADNGHRLDEAHRQSGWMLVFTIALLVVLLYSKLSMIPDGQTLFLILIILPLPFVMIVTRAYFRKDNWSLPWVTMIWIVSIAACFLMMMIEISYAINGDTWAVVQSGLLLFLCWSMMQRLRFLRHPIFQAWFDGVSSHGMHHIPLQSDEVLASCPNCQSLLAIRPMKLSITDECPNCETKLVSQGTINQFPEEE